MRFVGGRWLNVSKHATQGMNQERPPVSLDDLVWLFEEPDYDDGKEIRKRIGKRIVRAYYSEGPNELRVWSVSRSTREPR